MTEVLKDFIFIESVCDSNVQNLSTHTALDFCTSISKIFIKKGDCIFKNKELFEVRSILRTFNIVSNVNGVVEKINIALNDTIKFNDILFSYEMFENYEELCLINLENNFEALEDSELNLIVDDFDDSKTIKVSKVAGEETEYFKIYGADLYYYLGITFVNFNNNFYTEFLLHDHSITLSKGDTVTLLFEDKEKVEYRFATSNKGTKNSYYNTVPLTKKDIEIFLTKKLLKVKVVSLRKSLYSIYTLEHNFWKSSKYFKIQYQTKIEGQFLLNSLMKKFVRFHLTNQISLE